MRSVTEKKNFVIGGMWGLLTGDAVGVPYEYRTPEQLPPLERIELKPPMLFCRAYTDVKPGTWSEEGAQALCLLDSLVSCGKLDVDDFAARLVRWYEDGLWAVNKKVFSVNFETGKSIAALKKGVSLLKSGYSAQDELTCASLIRALPLALWHTGSDEELVNDAHLQSKVTNGDICTQVCSALFCLWARRIMDGNPPSYAYDLAAEKLQSIYPENSLYTAELEMVIKPSEAMGSMTNRGVAQCLNNARRALKAQCYEQVVKSAVALGNDTDATAAVAGGLAGIAYGVSNIPERWYGELMGKDMVDPLLYKAMDVMG